MHTLLYIVHTTAITKHVRHNRNEGCKTFNLRSVPKKVNCLSVSVVPKLWKNPHFNAYASTH